MSKIKLTGHASGTGVLTVTAPNTSTDRTITLPDATATLSTFEPDGAVVINESGADVDFRVEGSGEANALFVQGSDGKVGIGTSSPQHLLETSQSSSSKVIGLTLQNSMNTNSSTTGVGIKFKGSSYSDADETRKWAGIYGIANDTYHNKMGLSFYTNNDRTQEPTEKLQITSDGRGLSQFTAKAWCDFGNATGSNTTIINNSHNVSSVVDHAENGRSLINYQNTIGTNNVTSASYNNSGWGYGTIMDNGGHSATQGCVKFAMLNGSNDYCQIRYIVFGD